MYYIVTTTTTITTHNNSTPQEVCSFIEIIRPSSSSTDNDDDDPSKTLIEVYCIHVEPKQCSRVVKGLSKTLPLEANLAHLKRVRKVNTNTKDAATMMRSTISSPAVQNNKRNVLN